MPIRDWKAALNRFAIEFEGRFPLWIYPWHKILVATCNHNRSNLQSRHFQTRIIYNYKFSSARINCKWTSIICQWTCNHPFQPELTATIEARKRGFWGLSSNGTILYAKGVKHTQQLLQLSVFLYCQSQKVYFLRHPVIMSLFMSQKPIRLNCKELWDI